MLIGMIGAPNKGKSTIFSALTMVDAAIADYPFTTIKPNLGITYVSRQCPEGELGVKCKPRNSLCKNGMRELPINIIDVAGLVPEASTGKGMGNQFLNDLAAADVLIQVVDLSGATTEMGNPTIANSDPYNEIEIIHSEIVSWLSGIISRHIPQISKRSDGIMALREVLSGFRPTALQIENAASLARLSTTYVSWDEDSIRRFSDSFLRMNKPIVVAANKNDKSVPGALEALRAKLPGHLVVGCSGAIELALRKAAKAGSIEYTPGAGDFSIKGETTEEQRRALSFMKEYLKKNGSTGIQELIDASVFQISKRIVVYPVENENKYTDHFGNVLPDALLIKEGSTIYEVAEMIHTELAKKMLYAVDARTKNRLSREYVMKDNDIVKIVSAAK